MRVRVRFEGEGEGVRVRVRVFEDTWGFVRRCMCVTCEVCVCECAHLNMDNKIYDKANGGGGGEVV